MPAKHKTAEINMRQSEQTQLPKLAYSPEEAAQVLGVCRDTVYRLLKRGLLRSSTALRHKVIPHAEIERFLKATLGAQ